MNGARVLFAATAFLMMASLAACGGGSDDSSDSPDGSTEPFDASAQGEPPEGSPPDLPASDFDAGSFDLPADAAIATTSPTGCTEPALRCSDSFPGSAAFSSSTAADITGLWIYCSDAGGGFELAANGTSYNVIQNAEGDYVPDLDPSSMGQWLVKASTEDGYPVQLVIGELGGTGFDNVGFSTCPRALVFDTGVMALPAR